jgi:deoxyribose-phosphate aldolase
MTENLVLIDEITPSQLAGICDHTFLNRSEAYRKEGDSAVRLREQAFDDFLEGTGDLIMKGVIPYSLCVRPEDVNRSVFYLRGRVKSDSPYLVIHGGKTCDVVCSVVGFPDGSLYNTEFKELETSYAINMGAREVDMVLNHDRMRAGDADYVRRDIQRVIDTAHKHDCLVKLIFETSELEDDKVVREEQLGQLCSIANETGVDFVKTSTGFGAYGATEHDVMIMRKHFPRGVKISGGVSLNNYKSLLKAASGRSDGCIDLNPRNVRIGESSLLNKLITYYKSNN